ncbi:DUF4304 domain-containing protein [Streptomyces sp. NPDC004286]|uniref:DUF4304 domain-containing protein n=1 Tax=Streptomyces sp. NPDC004286 TaxID=3364696 RepID=UPI003674731B
MTSAAGLYADALRQDIEPSLRKLGLVGSRGCFELRDPQVWRLIGIQKSAGNSADRIRFTVNLLVVSKAVWQQVRGRVPSAPVRPSPNTACGKDIRPQRIGELMPGGQDHWWEVTERTRPERLARSVLSAVESYALPYLASTEDLLRSVVEDIAVRVRGEKGPADALRSVVGLLDNDEVELALDDLARVVAYYRIRLLRAEYERLVLVAGRVGAEDSLVEGGVEGLVG